MRVFVCVRGPDCRHNWIDSFNCEGCSRVNWCVFFESSPSSTSSSLPFSSFPPTSFCCDPNQGMKSQLVVAEDLTLMEMKIKRKRTDLKHTNIFKTQSVCLTWKTEESVPNLNLARKPTLHMFLNIQTWTFLGRGACKN